MLWIKAVRAARGCVQELQNERCLNLLSKFTWKEKNSLMSQSLVAWAWKYPSIPVLLALMAMAEHCCCPRQRRHSPAVLGALPWPLPRPRGSGRYPCVSVRGARLGRRARRARGRPRWNWSACGEKPLSFIQVTRLGQGVAFLTPARQRLHSGRRLNGQHRRSALPPRAAGPLTAGPLTAAPGLLQRGREAARGARQEAAVGAGQARPPPPAPDSAGPRGRPERCSTAPWAASAGSARRQVSGESAPGPRGPPRSSCARRKARAGGAGALPAGGRCEGAGGPARRGLSGSEPPSPRRLGRGSRALCEPEAGPLRQRGREGSDAPPVERRESGRGRRAVSRRAEGVKAANWGSRRGTSPRCAACRQEPRSF